MKPKSSLLNLFKSFPFSFVMSVPPTKICPAVTLSIVDMQFSNVVLPEPEEDSYYEEYEIVKPKNKDDLVL